MSGNIFVWATYYTKRMDSQFWLIKQSHAKILLPTCIAKVIFRCILSRLLSGKWPKLVIQDPRGENAPAAFGIIVLTISFPQSVKISDSHPLHVLCPKMLITSYASSPSCRPLCHWILKRLDVSSGGHTWKRIDCVSVDVTLCEIKPVMGLEFQP